MKRDKQTKDAIYCPKCGKEININSHFCKYCGFNLKKYQQELVHKHKSTTTPLKREQHKTIDAHDSRQELDDTYSKKNQDYIKKQKQAENLQRYLDYKISHSRKETIGWISGIVVVILLVGIFGVHAYMEHHPVTHTKRATKIVKVPKIKREYHTKTKLIKVPNKQSKFNPNNNSSKGTANKSINATPSNSYPYPSLEDNKETLQNIWGSIANEIQNNDTEFESDDFVNGDSNPSYKGIVDWGKDICKVNSQNQIDYEDIEIQPYQFKQIKKNKVSFHVKYSFPENNGNDDDAKSHIQTFRWTALINHHGKVISMKSSKSPIKDYTETND